MNRFLIKDPELGWVSVESETRIPTEDRTWRAKLDQMIAEAKFKEQYSFTMEFKGESYLAMILPGMERVNGENEGPHPSDYKADRWHSYSPFFFPQSDLDEAAMKSATAEDAKNQIKRDLLLKFAD